MISFFLNDKLIHSECSPSMVLLDFIRINQNLKGTKIGCREGDCGTCTVLIGSINQVSNVLEYKSVVSCLTLLGHVHNKHVVTIEGINDINKANLTPIQKSFTEGAVQCGYCTPGFIISATGYFLATQIIADQKLVDFLDGNICRCTGYKSIERACVKIEEKCQPLNKKRENIQYLVNAKIIPSYFLTIEDKLRNLQSDQSEFNINESKHSNRTIIGGGTDLLVQKSDSIVQSDLLFLPENKFILENEQSIIIGGSITTEEFFSSDIINNSFENFHKYKKLVASNQIRNTGTVAGNIINASPIGDLSIILLSLNGKLILKNGTISKEISLKNFFTGYKTLAKDEGELLEKIIISKPNRSMRSFFNFEKISKRTHLDIASVNSAIYIEITNDGIINNISLSAGGIAPVPKYLEKTCNFLKLKRIDSDLIAEAINIARDEVIPISDIRGSMEYKRLLLGQLLLAHFISLVPEYIHFEEVYS